MIAIVGYGNMGRAISRRLGDDFAVVDPDTAKTADLDVVTVRNVWDLADAPEAIIDFSTPAVTAEVGRYAVAHGVPYVLGTTGHTAAQQAAIAALATHIPIFVSPNMSPTVYAFIRACVSVARTIAGATITIHEIHRADKQDRPSGTAIAIAEGLLAALPSLHGWRLDEGTLCEECQRAGDDYIHVTSERLAGAVGTHIVRIAAPSQCVLLRHEAMDRGLFADGAIAAARYLIGKPAGLYGMADMEG